MQANYVFQSWTVDMKFNWAWLVDSVRMSSMSKWPTPQHLSVLASKKHCVQPALITLAFATQGFDPYWNINVII